MSGMLSVQKGFDQALDLASAYAGLTSPNPCVGAAALDIHGRILTVQAHRKAGEPHAEAQVIHELEMRGLLHKAHSLLVTLEPCNHKGRTDPCTEAILRAGIKRVYFGAHDPNPKVVGGGAMRLKNSGIEVYGPDEIRGLDPTTTLPSRCESLIQTFAHWARTSLPWVTLKTAIRLDGTMIPPPGQKTFTSAESLNLAHRLRKRSDAILTGSGTILADQPLFSVRHVEDHPAKKRWLAVLDRRRRVPKSYFEEAEARGFLIHHGSDLQETLRFLGSQGVLEVLVEAGPQLSQAIIDCGIWNQHVLIQQKSGQPDHVENRYRPARAF